MCYKSLKKTQCNTSFNLIVLLLLLKIIISILVSYIKWYSVLVQQSCRWGKEHKDDLKLNTNSDFEMYCVRGHYMGVGQTQCSCSKHSFVIQLLQLRNSWIHKHWIGIIYLTFGAADCNGRIDMFLLMHVFQRTHTWKLYDIYTSIWETMTALYVLEICTNQETITWNNAESTFIRYAKCSTSTRTIAKGLFFYYIPDSIILTKNRETDTAV